MFLVYNTLLLIAFVIMLPVFLYRMFAMRKYRAGLKQRFGTLPEEIVGRLKGARPIWLHCVSVGESIAAAPLAKALKERHPDIPLVVTTVTDTGQRVVKEKMPFADAVFYLPLDLPWVVRKVVGMISPRAFVVVETEIWPNLFREMHRRGIPTVMVNGRISDRSAGRYKTASFFIEKVLRGVATFGMQSQLDADRITAAGADKGRVQVTGNIKYDQPAAVMGRKEKESLRRELGLEEGERLIIAGSTHEGEEDAVIDAFRRLKAFYPELVLLLAPRHPERLGRVEDILRENGVAFVRRTLATERRGEPVILLDTMGELGSLYALCDVAFVGGSLVNVGGHNLLEPAAWGKPVLFGPHMHNFREIAEKLLSAGGGRRIAGGEELERALEEMLVPETGESMGARGSGVVEENRGALQRTVEMVERFLSPM